MCLGEGSYGKCFLKKFKRLGIDVVEKQLSGSTCSNEEDALKEAQIMQVLMHPNIPTVLGVQLEKKPYSIVMEFIGECKCSVTVHKLLQDMLLQKRLKLDNRDWIKISYNLADALGHIHKMGFLHCDLKSNNIVVSNKKGYIIDFGKASPTTCPPAKKYKFAYPHIAPEVIRGSSCSKQSDIYSLGTILYKIGEIQKISVITNIAKECLCKNPINRPTLTGIMSCFATQTEIPLI